MRGSTFTLRPSRFDRRNAGKISLFVSLSPFSLSLSDSSLSSLFALPSLFPFLFFSFFPYPPTLPSLICSILISFHLFPFSLFSFSLFFIFLFSPPSSFSYLYGSIGGNFPPLSSLATCHAPNPGLGGRRGTRLNWDSLPEVFRHWWAQVL